ncbi:hypothetical protein LTR39_000885 [Cryomyces antarcticus]|nr:hypothetical protein LTR39_000885 [Cryomyces antarcticus]
MDHYTTGRSDRGTSDTSRLLQHNFSNTRRAREPSKTFTFRLATFSSSTTFINFHPPVIKLSTPPSEKTSSYRKFIPQTLRKEQKWLRTLRTLQSPDTPSKLLQPRKGYSSFISAQEAEDYLRTTPDDSKVDVALAIQGAYESRKAIYEDNLASLWTIMEDFSSRQSAD